jgi:Alginate lyase
VAIAKVSTVQLDAFANNNLAATMVPATLGNCIFLVSIVRSATKNVTAVSGGGCNEWDNVGSFAYASANPTVQSIDLWIGRVTATGSHAVTMTASSSVSSTSCGYVWQEFTNSTGAGTSWVAEQLGANDLNASSTNITYPTLTPSAAGRAYIGYADCLNTSQTTGQTSGYTAVTDGASNQLLTNLSVSTVQSPIGKQNTAGTSQAMAILLYATAPDTNVASNVNIGASSGKNHFSLDTAFAGYADTVGLLEADLVNGWNTSPQFVATSDGVGVQMMVNVDSPTTPGSSFPRTEFRELSTDGVTLMGFNPATGTHWLRGRTVCTNLTVTKPTVVFGQCHNASSDIIALVTQKNTGSGLVELLIRINGTSSGTAKMSTNYTAGSIIDWMIEFSSSGYWAVYYMDLSVPFYDSVAHAISSPANPIVYSGSADCYFKAGCYANTNTASESGDATQFMQLELRYLQHWHTGWPTADPVVLPELDGFAPFFGGG